MAIKIMTETALSTMEAEIVSLAHSCIESFPVMDMVKLMSSAVDLIIPTPLIHTSIKIMPEH